MKHYIVALLCLATSDTHPMQSIYSRDSTNFDIHHQCSKELFISWYAISLIETQRNQRLPKADCQIIINKFLESLLEKECQKTGKKPDQCKKDLLQQLASKTNTYTTIANQRILHPEELVG